MLYEFQVFYLMPAAGAAAESTGAATWPALTTGPMQSMLVRAETREDARCIVSQVGMIVVNIGPGRPMVDWSKPTLSREEACVFLAVSDWTLRDLQAAGEIPRPARNGHSLFRLEELER